MQEEGVIKFDLQFIEKPLALATDLAELNAWRKILWQLSLIGKDPQRYGGYGFGNLSQRIAPFNAEKKRRAYLISGSQTGALANLDAGHYVVVNEYDAENNRIMAEGPIKPSSESLTHGMIYDMDINIRVILHAHSPDIWRHAQELGLPVTDKEVPYGTPAMAGEVERLFHGTNVQQTGIFSMAGHEDGIISFGRTPAEAGTRMLHTLALGYAL